MLNYINTWWTYSSLASHNKLLKGWNNTRNVMTQTETNMSKNDQMFKKKQYISSVRRRLTALPLEFSYSAPVSGGSTGQLTQIFLSKFQDLQRKEFSTIIEIFLFLQKLQLLQYSILYFKITRKNEQSLVMFNVQCCYTAYFEAHSKCPSQFSHKLDVFLWCSVWPCWLSPAAAGFISTARLSSVHQCSLAWDKMSCSVQV